MLGKIFGIFCILSLLFAIFNGTVAQVGDAVLDGAGKAVEVLLSLGGMMCFWCGIMRVLGEAGLIAKLSRLLSPVLRLFFPDAARTKEGLEEISANISANLLGIGNAATPFALQAMEKLQNHNPNPDQASQEQITLAVLNTASVTLIPANLLALRRAAGSPSPYKILIPIWITSLLSAAMALFLTSIPRIFEKKESPSKSTACHSRQKSGKRQ